MRAIRTIPEDCRGLREEEERAAAWQREFEAFKAGEPGRDIVSRLCLSEYMEAATSWQTFRSLVTDLNDNKDRGCVVDIARSVDGVCSSGERILLHAILYALDFAWLADELAGVTRHERDGEEIVAGRVWRDMNRVSGPHMRAVQACIGAWS